MSDPTAVVLAGTIAWGLAIAGFAWAALSLLTDPAPSAAPPSTFEVARRRRLREGSAVYRWFEPGVDRMARLAAGRKPERLARLRRDLSLSAEPLPWTPEEYLALGQLYSILAAAGGLLFGLLFFGSWVGGVLVGLVLAVGYQLVRSGQAGQRAQQRLAVLKRRLPFTVDLMALMMEAGASFQESVATAARENAGHPLGDELTLVLRDINLGRTRQDALLALQQRLGDEDVAEIVFAVNKGEELGTPMSQILRNQAEQMRLKRSQWAEKAAGEAQVNIVFPGMIIMVACLIIVIAPFILGAFY